MASAPPKDEIVLPDMAGLCGDFFKLHAALGVPWCSGTSKNNVTPYRAQTRLLSRVGARTCAASTAENSSFRDATALRRDSRATRVKRTRPLEVLVVFTSLVFISGLRFRLDVTTT